MKLYRAGNGTLLLVSIEDVLVYKIDGPVRWRKSSILKADVVSEGPYFTLIGNNVKIKPV